MSYDTQPARRRIVEMAPTEPSRVYVSDAEDDDLADVRAMQRRGWLHERTQEHVASLVGVGSHQHVAYIELVALEKVKIGLEIEARLGPIAAGPVLARLRGRPIDEFRAALATVLEQEP